MKHHAIVIADRDGVIQLWNAGAEQLFGHAAAEAIGRKVDLIIPAQFHEAHWKGFHHAIAAGTAAGEGTFFDAPTQHGSGEVRTLRGQLHVLRSENDGAIGAMAIFTLPA